MNNKDYLKYLASENGRKSRSIAGGIIIAVGLLSGSPLLILVGLLHLLGGMFDWCFAAPLFGMPFEGTQLRKALSGSKKSTSTTRKSPAKKAKAKPRKATKRRK